MEVTSIFVYMHRNTPLKRILYYGPSLSFFSVLRFSFNKTPAGGKRTFESMMVKEPVSESWYTGKKKNSCGYQNEIPLNRTRITKL